MPINSDTGNIFVAATRQNDGKTMVSLGLFNAFRQRFNSVGYIKPVGQQYRIVDGKKIDKDAVLMQTVYDLTDPLPAMSPIAIPRGFTANYIRGGKRQELVQKIERAYTTLTNENEFVLVEGTGHAGVGSVFDMSNADVAKLLGARVIIVSRGGVGRPIDEILLNKSVFDSHGVEVLGVIVNKINPDKQERIAETVTAGLAKQGLRVLGTIPMVPMLNTPSVAELAEDIEADVLYSNANLMNRPVGRFVIGDMQPHNAIDEFRANSLLITPGNREGLIVTALCGKLLETQEVTNVSSIIFTHGIKPHEKIMELIKQSQIPVMLVHEDSFTVAQRINNSIFKLRAEEGEKIKKSQALIEKFVDVDYICENL